MTPTEQELTTAADAVARLIWASAYPPGSAEFDELHPMHQHRLREQALPVATAVLEALPDRAIAERARVVAKVREYACTCHTAEYSDAGAHEDWCPASAVDDELLDLT